MSVRRNEQIADRPELTDLDVGKSNIKKKNESYRLDPSAAVLQTILKLTVASK